MQNQIKTETRLTFIQFVFSTFFSDKVLEDQIISFENYFYKLPVSSIEKNKESFISFNKNYFKKLALNYNKFIKNNNIENIINPLINFERKFKNWDTINKTIILCILSEIEITKQEKVKILLNDYFNISKSLINKKEQGMLNAITDKYLNEKNFI
jgi:transcription termination factor NusB